MANSRSLKDWYTAVGISCLQRKSFINSFEPSSCAASLLGPKQFRLSDSNLSGIPLTKGTSGPTMVKSIRCSVAKIASLLISSAAISTLVTPSSFEVPPLPGAT